MTGPSIRINSLAANGVGTNREHWLKEAVDTENSGAVLNCQAIIKFVIGRGVEDEDRKHSWLEDADNFTSQVKKQKQNNFTTFYRDQDLFFFFLFFLFIDSLIGCIRVFAYCLLAFAGNFPS